MIHITSDFSAIDREIDRITNRQPTRKMKRNLDAVLELGFAQTQAVVHVETGSLKSSGNSSSKSDRLTKRWEGEIQYGGPSTSINNPVDYAIYEKRRDGAHDFFAPLHLLHPLYVSAILRGLET